MLSYMSMTQNWLKKYWLKLRLDVHFSVPVCLFWQPVFHSPIGKKVSIRKKAVEVA